MELSRGTRVSICLGAFCVPWDRDRGLRDERYRDNRDLANYLSKPWIVKIFSFEYVTNGTIVHRNFDPHI